MTRAGTINTIVIAMLLSITAAFQMLIDSQKPLLGEAPDMLWVRSPKMLKRLSLGYEGLLADIYWTRAVQYYGGQRRDHNVDLNMLSPLLDLTVELDPKLLVAYKFGGFILGEPAPIGANRPDQAIRLIKKGIENNPEHWRFWADLGFIYYDQLKDFPAAAAAYLEGSKHPDAAPWMKVMAATITQKGGNRDTSRFLWSEIYKSTEDETIRINASLHLKGLEAMDEIAELQKVVTRYQEQNGRPAESFGELVKSGMINRIPKDPEGLPYRISADGKVILDPSSHVKLE